MRLRWQSATFLVALCGCVLFSSSRGWSQDRLPESSDLGPTLAADMPVRLPATAVSAARVNNLEARIAELEARLEEQSKQFKPVEKDDKGYEVGSDNSLTAKWNYGLELQSKNKDFKAHVGGRVQYDTSWYTGFGNIENSIDNGGVGPLQDATNPRRMRLRVDGTMYDNIDYACEFDFVNQITDQANIANPQSNTMSVPSPTDVWITWTQIPVLGNMRVGSVKDPWSFEHLTSSRWLNFMERSYGQDVFHGAFNNGFLPGAYFFNTMLDERGTWAVGEFKNTNNIFEDGVGDGELSTVGRLTYLPLYLDDGRYLVHVGLATRFLALDEDRVRFRSRADIRSGNPGPSNPIFANTGFIAGDRENQIGLEYVSVMGPWSIQSEYYCGFVLDATTMANNSSAGFQPVPGTPLGTYFAQGAYCEVHYFLTGEHRAYNRKTAVFDRVIPFENFFFVRDRSCGDCCSGLGAWQLCGRVARMDLNDSGVNGGILTSCTVGVNWFWNPNMKWQFNYDYMNRDFTNTLGANGSGQMSSFGGRLAFDF